MPRGLACTARLALLAVVVSGVALADLPTGTLSFVQPSGTVGPNDTVPVLLTLTLADTTGALQTDGSGHVAGLTASEIESNLVNSITLDVPSISADMAAGDISTDLNMWFLCAGTFVNGCGAGTYQWNWGSSADWTTPQPSSSLSFATNLNVPDGGSQDFTARPGNLWVACGSQRWD